MTQNIFLSVGRPSTKEQEDFIETIEKYLISNGLTPNTVGRTYYKNTQPLISVKECMQECVGTVILAFERTSIEKGVEKKGSPEQMELSNVNLTTVWNQIEATMSYSMGIPILVLVEHSIRNEGLLEKGYDWYVKKVSLDKSVLTESEFIGVFSDWKDNLRKEDKTADKNKAEEINVSELTIGQIFKSMKPAQLWGIGAAIIAVLSAVAVTAFNLGKMFSK